MKVLKIMIVLIKIIITKNARIIKRFSKELLVYIDGHMELIKKSSIAREFTPRINVANSKKM